MSLSDRRTFLAALAAGAALGGCGFQPVYGPGGAAEGLNGQIEVAAPEDRKSFDLVRRLEERLGQPQAARYALDYTLALDEDDLGITPEQEITRYNVLGTARYTLTDTTSGAVVTSGAVNNFTSYAATGTTVSTLTAQRAAYARLMVVLADQITARLLATAGSWTE